MSDEDLSQLAVVLLLALIVIGAVVLGLAWLLGEARAIFPLTA